MSLSGAPGRPFPMSPRPPCPWVLTGASSRPVCGGRSRGWASRPPPRWPGRRAGRATSPSSGTAPCGPHCRHRHRVTSATGHTGTLGSGEAPGTHRDTGHPQGYQAPIVDTRHPLGQQAPTGDTRHPRGQWAHTGDTRYPQGHRAPTGDTKHLPGTEYTHRDTRCPWE